MSGLEAFLVSRFMLFTLVLARTSGLMLSAPLLSGQGIPMRIRALLAFAMSLVVAPVYLGTAIPPVEHIGEFGRLMANEVLVGMLLGLGVNILFAGIQVAGQIVSQMSGLALADVFNPGFDDNVSLFSQLFYFVTMAVFVAIGGHRIMAEALLETFVWAPPGYAVLGDSFVEVLTSVLSQSFVLGIQAAAPLMVALLLATLVLGLVSRTMPQINIIAVGFGLNSLLTLSLLVVTLGMVAWTFQEPTVDMLYRIQEAIAN